MTEIEKLKHRLFGDPNQDIVGGVHNFHFTPGPHATSENVAREINRAFDEMEAGRATRSSEAPRSAAPVIDVREFVRGL